MGTTLTVGTQLPPFELQDQAGAKRSLPDPDGPTLLVFYRGDW
ncbi:MAG TPA: hypothetical protein VM674_01515 [Candidatus Acidoferrum sp.]|nr:hypothetical protein [Candidatus Acidoferrum sp.]